MLRLLGLYTRPWHGTLHLVDGKAPLRLYPGKRQAPHALLGVTSHLVQRVWQHKHYLVPGFSKDYCVHDLVGNEVHGTMGSAIAREKALKKWNRLWKLRLDRRVQSRAGEISSRTS